MPDRTVGITAIPFLYLARIASPLVCIGLERNKTAGSCQFSDSVEVTLGQELPVVAAVVLARRNGRGLPTDARRVGSI